MKRILYVVTLVALALAAPLTALKVGDSDSAHAAPQGGCASEITATGAGGQEEFRTPEDVFINGKGFPASTKLTFTVTHQETGTVVASGSIDSGPDGGFTAQFVWDGLNAFEGNEAYRIVVTPAVGCPAAADEFQYLDDRPPPPRQVTICHATSAVTNPYRMPSPAITNNGDLLGGHLNHTGPVYPEDNWGDIIPPYEYRTPSGQLQRYAGANWLAGEAIYQNDCHPPGLPPAPDPATKSGRKFNDLQGDGVNDNSDPGLAGWEIRAYADDSPGNGVLDADELADGLVDTDTTASDTGAYSLILAPGSYIICEVQKAGWTQTFPAGGPAECDAGPSLGAQGYAVTLASGDNDTGNAFGNTKPEQALYDICHATGDESIPYSLESPAILLGGALEGDHRMHGGDILPPYTYFDANGEPHEFPGQNWDVTGQETLQHNCVPTTPPPPNPKLITPAAECVELLAGGGFRAHFGYDNPNPVPVPIPVGPKNAFSPGDEFRGQPTEFLTGSRGDVVQVESEDGAPLTWTITGDPATATLGSPRCEGSITITKLLNPSDDPGLFNLEIDGESVRPEGPAGDGDTTGPIAVTAGTHTVGESGAATNLSRYDTQIVCRPNSGAGAVLAGTNSVSVQVTVGSGDAVVCTITNTRKQPRPLTPVLECVVINEGALNVAVWGYENPNDHAVEIDVGNLNRFSPGDQDRGQPITFEPGSFAAVFQTPFEAGAGGLTWTLTGNTATASSSSPPCTPPQPLPQPPPDVLDLELTKTASPTTVRVGELITWTMTVTNRSTVAAGDVSGARVDDRPFRMEMVSLSTTQGTCSPPDGCNLGRLLPGGSVTVTAVTRATQVGEVVNCVRVGSEEIESGYVNNTACAVAHVTGDAPPILDRCRSLVVSPRLLRAARESIVLVTARNLLGRPLAHVGVRARGAGITALTETNARGIARFVVTAPRLGTIRFRGVGPGTRTLTANACKTRLGVLPPRQPPPLTGRSD